MPAGPAPTIRVLSQGRRGRRLGCCIKHGLQAAPGGGPAAARGSPVWLGRRLLLELKLLLLLLL